MEHTAKTDAEIIELLAREVMGWKWCDRMFCWYPPGGTLADSRGRNQWNPLDSIADAWMIVEKKHKPLADSTVPPDTVFNFCLVEHASGWIAGWQFADTNGYVCWHGPTLSPHKEHARAICNCHLAALSAIRNQSAKEK